MDLLRSIASSPCAAERLTAAARLLSSDNENSEEETYEDRSDQLCYRREDMATAWRSFLTYLECSACGQRHDADQLQTVCAACGKVLFARYDLDGVRQAVKPTEFASRRWDMWRYWELLPVRQQQNVISLGEGLTPLVGIRAEASKALGME